MQRLTQACVRGVCGGPLALPWETWVVRSWALSLGVGTNPSEPARGPVPGPRGSPVGHMCPRVARSHLLGKGRSRSRHRGKAAWGSCLASAGSHPHVTRLNTDPGTGTDLSSPSVGRRLQSPGDRGLTQPLQSSWQLPGSPALTGKRKVRG